MDEQLGQIYPQHWSIDTTLAQSIQYSLTAGGKRLRPILVLAAAEALEGPSEAAMPVACAVEMIHTYSLIHDDLPAMDNDDYRRGKLTSHKVFGEGMAILAGDALLTHAFYKIVESHQLFNIPAEQTLAIIAELSMLSGAGGMVGGQAADMTGEQGITSLAELEYIHHRKTGDLIVFSLIAGGRIAGATEEQLAALRIFGYHIGLAFQIQDDILDVTGDESKMGKKVKSDEKQRKVTYPYFIGLESSIRKVEQLTQDGKEAILKANFPNPERLLELADYLMERDH
ncbi:MAG TPA: farnesyl diphosphate synthase [Bacilli bacterium]